MSRFDKNPFDEDGGNPFTEPPPNTNTGTFFDSIGMGSMTAKPAHHAPSTAERFDSTTSTSAPQLSLSELQRKEREMQNKELALKRKEEELRRREAALGLDHKNFPPCFPIIHHDIANDIPSYLQYIQRAAFVSWIGIMCCLVYNLIGVSVAWADGAVTEVSGVGNFVMATIYLLLGVPLSYFLWYQRLYNSLRKDSAIGFVVFFIGYSLHCVFVLYACIAPPIFFNGRSLTGVWATTEFLANGWILSTAVYGVGAGLFILEFFWSTYVLNEVYAYFRGTGKAVQMKREAALGIVNSSV